MRKTLEKLSRRPPRSYTGTYVKTTLSYNRNRTCLHATLLKDVKTIEGKPIGGDGHVWIATSYPVYNLEEGDRVQFTASIKEYRRRDGTKDFTLTDISSVKKINNTGAQGCSRQTN